MSASDPIVIVAAARAPLGGFQGAVAIAAALECPGAAGCSGRRGNER